MSIDHRQLGVDLFNGTWTMMEQPDRTPDEDALMIHMAHASAYHWLQVGAPENVARSHWQCSVCIRCSADPSPLYTTRSSCSTSASRTTSATGTWPSPTRHWPAP